MKHVLLFGRDPGGAQAVASLIPSLLQQNYSLSASGLDYGAQHLRHPDVRWLEFPPEDAQRVEWFLHQLNPALVITGTSGEGQAEKLLWRQGETLQIPSLAILDSWVNYGIRFSSKGLSQWSSYHARPDLSFLPTWVAVMDELARLEMILEGLPAERLLVTGQPSFDALIQRAKQSRPAGRTILFVSEPIEKSYGSHNPLGYSEKSIFRAIVETLHELEVAWREPIELVVRLHPREDFHSYDELISRLATPTLKISKSQAGDLHPLIEKSRLVLGMGSNVLVEAFLLGAPVAVVQIGLQSTNPSVLCRAGHLESWSTREKLRAGLEELLLEPAAHSRAARLAVEPAIPKILRIVSQLCQNPKQSPQL